MKLKKLKKICCITFLIVYMLSYFLQSLNYVDFGQKAYAANVYENQLDYTNIIAILVDNDIYNTMDDEIQWYAKNYIQGVARSHSSSGFVSNIISKTSKAIKSLSKKNGQTLTENQRTLNNTEYNKYNAISNSKAIVFPIDVENITAPEITKILENLYFDGIEGESSHLIGIVLIGDIPLPVVNQNGFVFPTIYPYVDFEEQKYVWDNKSQYFVYNDNKKGEAEIRHGWIQFDTIEEYEQYFDKLKDYANNPGDFVGKNIWYDDFIGNRTFFYQPGLNAYINSFLFAEDLGYKRFSDLMIAIMQGEHNESVSTVLQKLGDVLSGSNYTGNYASGMDTFMNTPELSTPTMTIKKILYEGYVSTYTSLFGVKYMDMIQKNIATANRWIEEYSSSSGDVNTRDALDTHYIIIEEKDETLLRNNGGLDPLLIAINNLLEGFVDDKVASEKYRLNEVIPLTYLDYEGALYGGNCTWKTYDAFENYFFGTQAKYMTSMQEVSSYRGTYRNYQGISGLTINDIQNSNQPSTDLDIDLNKKSVGGSYEIFAQQVDANRGYNINNTITELNLYDTHKTAAREEWSLRCEKKFLGICRKKRKWHYTTHKDSDGNEVFIPETPQGYAIRNRGGASPLNLDEDMGWRSGYNFQDSVTSVYDIGGSKALTSPENEANSYLGVNKYTRLIQRKFVVKAYRKNGIDLRKKFFFKNKSRLDPDVNGKGYNSSMGEDVLFTNYLPSYKKDDGDDIGQDDTGFNRVYNTPKLANSVDYFTIYKTSGINIKERQGNIIKLAKKNSGQCKGNGKIYTYKTLDSRVKNSATNTIDIGGRTYYAFTDQESPIYQLYESLEEEVSNLQSELANSPVSTNSSDGTGVIDNLNALKSIINNANNRVNNIINMPASAISGWTDDFIASYANNLSNSYNSNTWQNINDIVNDLEVSLQEVNNFFEYFSFEDISDYLSSKTTEFTINNRELIFYTPWKASLQNQIDSIYQTFSGQAHGLKTRRNNAKNVYDDIEDILNSSSSVFKNDNRIDSIKSDLNTKYNNIDDLPGGCTNSRYSSLCAAIISVRNNLNNSGREVADRIKGRNGAGNNDVDGISVFWITKYKKNGNVTTEAFRPFNSTSGIGSNVDTSDANTTYTASKLLLGAIPTTSDTGYQIQVEGMNITTSDRPIDSPKYMTFKGVGGDEVTFIYPDLYKVEVYTGNNEKLTLLSPDEIADNIRDYLRAVVIKYNSYLTGQQAKASNYYNQNSNAYNLLNQLDPLANPNHVGDSTRPYGLFDENYLVNLLEDRMRNNGFFSGNMGGYEPIEFLAHMIYYQNIEWPERLVGDTIQDDMDNIRQSFDINQKITHIFDNYIVSDNNYGPFITPGYRDDGYEVAYINSDGNDYIVYETELPFMESIKSSAAAYKKPSTSDAEKSQLEEELANECNIPENGNGVLLFDLKTMSSPWIEAIKCRWAKLREKPIEFSISVSYGSSVAGFAWNGYESETIAQGWDWDTILGDFGIIGNSALSQLGFQNASNDDVLNNASAQTFEKLNKINSYVNVATPNKAINADNPSSTIQISSNVDLGNVYIRMVNAGDSKISVSNSNGIISPNITMGTEAFSTGSMTVNPYDGVVLNLHVMNPVAGSDTIMFYMCPNENTNINECIQKPLDLHIVPGAIQQIEIVTQGNTMMKGAQLPILVKGLDANGNNVGQLLSERYKISTSAGNLLRDSVESSSISFSNFDESIFVLDTKGIPESTNQIILTVSGPIGGVNYETTKTINLVKGKLNISYSGSNISVNSTNSTNTTSTNTITNTNTNTNTKSNATSSLNSTPSGSTTASNKSNNKSSNITAGTSKNSNSTDTNKTTSISKINSIGNTNNKGGLSQQSNNINISSTNAKGTLNASNQSTSNNSNNTINITLPDNDNYSYKDEFDLTQANSGAIPKLSLTLTDQNGNILTNTNHVISVSSKKRLVKIGGISLKMVKKNTESGTFSVPQYRFAQTKTFTLQSGHADIYLWPTFKAGSDTIYISMPGIDTIAINLNVEPSSPKVVKINTKYDNIKVGSSINGEIKIYDNRDNLVTKNVAIRLGNTGPLQISETASTSEVVNVVGGSKDLLINADTRGGIGYIYAMIDGIGLSDQQAGYKKITVQDSILPSENLNIMYLNLFGSDRGNQWGYFSDNDGYIQYLISHSEKLLTATSQLVSPSNLKEFVIAMDNSLNIYDLGGNNISLKLDDGINIGIDNIGSFVLDGNFNFSTGLDSINHNGFVYIPEETDSIITSNVLENKKIIINENVVFDATNWTQDDKLQINLSDEYLSGYQVWDVLYDDRHVGDLLIVVNDEFNLFVDIADTNYDYSDIWLQGSTNKYGIGIYNMDSTFDESILGYKSIQDSVDPEAGIGFTADFKNITNFGAGQPVGEATVPFSSEFLINIGDPMLRRIDDNQSAKVFNSDGSIQEDTEFDKGLGELIYSDPSNTIFKVINIDFNHDNLEDIIVIYSDGTIKLLKNYGGTNPFRDLGPLMVLADRIKDVITGDVDGNGYEDIIIWTESNVLRVYHNYEGIFEVDGYPICININVHAGEISQTPSRVNGLSQIFFEDMDKDGSMDIVTNDMLGFIKIFYGGKNNPYNEDNYVSTNQYMCDENRYQRLTNSTTNQNTTSASVSTKNNTNKANNISPSKGNDTATLSKGNSNSIAGNDNKLNSTTNTTKNNSSSGNKGDTAPTVTPLNQGNTSSHTKSRTANYESNENTVYRFAAKVNSSVQVLDESYVRRKGINPNAEIDVDLADLGIDTGAFAPQDTGGMEKMKLSQIKNKFNIAGKLEQATNFDVSAAIEIYSQANRYKVASFGKIPLYESGVIDENDIQYVPIGWIDDTDPIKVYKKYEDLNGDVLEDGDKVEVTVTLQATSNLTGTLIDNISGPRIIPLNEDLDMIENFWFESGTITPEKVNNELVIHRDLDNNRYMIDNIGMKAGDTIKIHYWVYFKGTDIMNISLKDIDGSTYKQNGNYMTQYPTDGFVDIKTQPTDGCNPSMYAFFNEGSGYQRDYQIEYIDLSDLTKTISNNAQQNYDEAVTDLNNNMLNIVNDDGKVSMDGIPGMSSILESAIVTDMFSDSFNLGSFDLDNLNSTINNILNLPNDIIDGLLGDITDKITSFVYSSCGAFSLKSLLGITSCNTYIPFNESFLGAGDYHLFGCFNIQPLTQLIGKGMPLLNIPGNRGPTPYGYIPAPGLFGYPWKGATDSFSFGNDGGSYPSFFRLYVMPTLTAEIGFALCFGPYASTLALPDPMGSVGGNCVVFTVPIPCNKKDKDHEAPDETLPSSTLAEYADMQTCEQTTNTPRLGANQSDTSLQMAAGSPNSNNMTSVNQASSTSQGTPHNDISNYEGTYLGGFIHLDVEPSTMAGYSSETSPITFTVDGVDLIGGASQKNKILGSMAKGLIEKVVKSRLDKQIKYTMSSLTFNIGITWPDLSILTEGWDSIGENLKTAVADQYGTSQDRKECKEKGGTFVNGGCLTQQQQCENKGKQWKNGSCVAKTNKSANDEGLDSLSTVIDSKWISREEIEQASESNFADPLAFLETAFEDVPLINISTQEITVKVPMITSDDITSYITSSQNWLERQKQILEEWKDIVFGIIGFCGGRKISNISELKDAVEDLKQQLKDEFMENLNNAQNQIDALNEQIKNAVGQNKSDLEAQRDQLQAQLNEMAPYISRMNALDNLNKKYDLSAIDGYMLRERNDGNFLLQLKEYQLDGEIMPVDIYLLYNTKDGSLTEFTQGVKLNTKKRGGKTVVTSVDSNGGKVQNGDLDLKQIVAGKEGNKCVDLFLGGSFDVALNGFISIQVGADDLVNSVKQNLETLELYKKYPTQLYEWMHVADDYLGEVSSFLNSFLSALSMWMKTNATRYSQYVNAIINIMTTIETYQAIIDLSVNFNKKCSTCSNDNYNQFTCKLGMICPDGILPTLPIPPMKIPGIYLDFSNINIGTDIKLPKFKFITIGVDLPKLPDLPSPPSFEIDVDSFGSVGFDAIFSLVADLGGINIEGSLPSIPLIPSPPELQDPPALKIESDISLPLLPPAPEIPALPNELSIAINAAEVIGEILCLVKRLPLVNETSVKAKVEQLSERTYEVPYWDTMDQTFKTRGDKISSSLGSSILKKFMPFLSATEFKDVDIKGFDIKVESYINLQINFDEFYNALDSIVGVMNDFSETAVDVVNTASNNASAWMNDLAGDLQKCISDPLAYSECFSSLGIDGVDDTISNYLNIKDRLDSMKSYIKDGFANIGKYRQELANLQNEKESIQEDIQKINESISNLDNAINAVLGMIQSADSEFQRANLLATLNAYNSNKASLESQLYELQESLTSKEAKYTALSNKYGPEIEAYDKAMDAYNSLYGEYQSLTSEINVIKESVINTISQGGDMISSGASSVFDKLNEASNSINSKSESVDEKQRTTKEQRYQNLQELYKEVDSISYNDNGYNEKVLENNKKILLTALNSIKDKTDNAADIKEIDSYIKLLENDSNIYPSNEKIDSVQKQYTLVLKNFKDETDKIEDMIANDYDQFLYAISNDNTRLVNDDNSQITIAESLFTMDKNVKNILSNSENVYKMYLDYYNENLDGYIDALDTHSAQDLDMDEAVYELNKEYLNAVKEKTKLAYAVLDGASNNAENITDENEILIAQNTVGGNSSNSNNTSSSVVNLSNYFDGQIISTPEGGFMLANSEFTKEFENQSIMTDINKDGKNDLILRDDHEIYIKYRDNNTSYANTEYNDKYYVYNIPSYNHLLQNTNGCIAKINNINVKLCDTNREVKNFQYAGSDFDNINVSWSNSTILGDEVAGYLVKLIHRVDLFGDNEEIVNNSNRSLFDKKYIVVLPKGTDIEGMKIRLDDGKVVDISSDNIFDVQYYNDSKEIIDLTITDIPRNWQYSQVSTLEIDGGIYTINSSTSNQVVGGPQIIADDEGPDVEIGLYRPATNTVIDTGEVFDGYVSTRYILKSYREDNALLDTIWITNEDGEILTKKSNIFTKTGYIERGDIMFTEVGIHHYYFVGSDINGNMTSSDVTLTIKTPTINIVNIGRHITSNINSGIPVSITAEIDQDLDEGVVQFLRKRNNTWELMTGVLGGIKSDKYLLEPLQTIITGAYFDFGDDIGLYLSNGKMAAKINPDNGKISIEPGYNNIVSISVDYANHAPIVKVTENNQNVLMMLQFTSESLVDLNVYGNLLLKDLDGNQFGTFNGGKAIIDNNEILLYVSPKGDIYTDQYLYGNYSFDEDNQAVVYSFRKSKYGKDLGYIKIKIKNLLQY